MSASIPLLRPQPASCSSALSPSAAFYATRPGPLAALAHAATTPAEADLPRDEEIDEDEPDMLRAIVEAVDEVTALGAGDVLIFLSGSWMSSRM